MMNKTKFANKEFLSVKEVKEWLGISQAAVYNLTHRRDFPVAHFGGTIRIPRDPFLAWVAMNTSNPMHYGEHDAA